MRRARNVISFPITTSDTPTVKEAMNASPPEVAMWRNAITKELTKLAKKGTWEELGKISRKGRKRIGPNGERLIPTHVILKIKRNPDSHPVRFKARVVAGGNLQIKNLDYDGVYAPVVDFF